MDIAGVDVEIDVIRELPELEDLEVNPSTEDQSFNSSKYGFKNVIIKGIKGDKLELNPSLEQQNLKGVFTEVNINPIQTKKLNATPTTQEQVISGLFDEVTVNAIEGQELNLNPSEEQQNYEGVFLGVNIKPIQVEEITTDLDFSSSDEIEITPKEGAYIKKTTINKPTNLTPENIKSGETVCGIAGINADTSDADATSNDIIAGKTAYVANEKIAGTYIPLDTSDATATAKDIVEGKTAYVNGKKMTGTMLPSFDTSQITSCYQMFYNNTTITELKGLDASNVTTAHYMFYGCKALETVQDFNSPVLTDAYYMFYGCTNLKTVGLIDMGKVTTVEAMFANCTNLESLGGFKDLGKAYTAQRAHATYYTLALNNSNSITHDSLVNILNNLYDLNVSYNVANGGTLYKQTVNMGSTNKAKLQATEEGQQALAEADAKGWRII